MTPLCPLSWVRPHWDPSPPALCRPGSSLTGWVLIPTFTSLFFVQRNKEGKAEQVYWNECTLNNGRLKGQEAAKLGLGRGEDITGKNNKLIECCSTTLPLSSSGNAICAPRLVWSPARASRGVRDTAERGVGQSGSSGPSPPPHISHCCSFDNLYCGSLWRTTRHHALRLTPLDSTVSGSSLFSSTAAVSCAEKSKICPPSPRQHDRTEAALTLRRTGPVFRSRRTMLFFIVDIEAKRLDRHSMALSDGINNFLFVFQMHIIIGKRQRLHFMQTI